MSLYLKYRPIDFKNLVGQSFVKNTLQKAILNNKTVGAYLFCGPRGTGKTSTARIFAKTVNCLNPVEGNPCLKCDICTSFLEEKLIDIIEIDAASHTGVDNIREIIEKAQFSPTKTKYKIYIIDEVHMLSKGAFNALLKILEEPPKHVKFILATTETHKVPETIISRCQRYDFKRIADEDITNRLLFIAKSENIKTDEKSINYIVKNSAGGLRNAISLFEQLIENSEINYSNLVKKLEIVNEDEINIFLEKLLTRDKTVIDILEKNISDGKNIKLFFKELMFYTKDRSLEILKKGGDISNHIYILDILDDSYIKTKNSLDENLTFTIGIFKILNGNNKNNDLETKIKGKNLYTNSVGNSEKSNPISKKEEIKEEEISTNDVLDIFGEEKIQNPSIVEKETKIDNLESGNFTIDSFINKLKENKVKSANINTIKNSTLELQNNKLIIKTSNSFLKKTLEKDDVINLFVKSLSDLGIENPNIEIK